MSDRRNDGRRIRGCDALSAADRTNATSHCPRKHLRQRDRELRQTCGEQRSTPRRVLAAMLQAASYPPRYAGKLRRRHLLHELYRVTDG
jgi:hypothetical protein